MRTIAIMNNKGGTCKTVCDYCKPTAPAPETPLPTEPPECQTVLTFWMPGGTTPVEPGTFATLVDLGDGTLHYKFFLWDGAAWAFLSGVKTTVTPVWWLRLPPAPEKGE